MLRMKFLLILVLLLQLFVVPQFYLTVLYLSLLGASYRYEVDVLQILLIIHHKGH